MDKDQVLKQIKEVIPLIQENLSLDCLVLYGSYAQGTAKLDSDIDLAIISRDIPKGILNDNVLDTIIKIRDVNLKFEPHFFRLEKWNNAEAGSFEYEIKKTGKIIYSNGLQ